MKRYGVSMLLFLLCIFLLMSCSSPKQSDGYQQDPTKGNKWDQMKWDQGKWSILNINQRGGKNYV